MHKAKLLTSLFFLIIGFWPIVPCAQDSEQYQEVLGWDLADTSGCEHLNNCYGRGQCKGGACLCHCAFAGTSCELTMGEYCHSLEIESKISFKKNYICFNENTVVDGKKIDVCKVLKAVPVDCGCRILFFVNKKLYGNRGSTWNNSYNSCYDVNNIVKMHFPNKEEIKKIHGYMERDGDGIPGVFEKLWLDPTIKGKFVSSDGTSTEKQARDFSNVGIGCVGTHYFRAGDTELEVD